MVGFYIREQGVGLVFDTTASEQVWNFPAWSVDLSVEETTDPAALDLVNINTADLETLDALPGIGETLAGRIMSYREQVHPFQTIDELDEVQGIGPNTIDGLRDQVTVDPVFRTFEVDARVTLTTDGVAVTHVDSGDPDSFTESWGYTLKTDEAGQIIEGTWDREDHHPDFAWVPYSNPHSSQSGGSENPYLPYGELLDVIGADFERK
ncbi:MAG: helix-hairpin-helix domain-containing protein [Alphaproteobacteria bacterium]|nr:helix-hairpin-helix domain-containing protein [Alphaproteobacteria bacterium]